MGGHGLLRPLRLPEGFSVVWVNRYRLPAGYVGRRRGNRPQRRRFVGKASVSEDARIIFWSPITVVLYAPRYSALLTSHAFKS